MKVTELKAELTQRGLDAKGLKQELVVRLSEALEKEKAAAAQTTQPAPAPTSTPPPAAKPEEKKADTAKQAPSNGAPASTPAPVIAPPVSASADAASSVSADGSALSEEDRKKQRAARFGVPLTESEEEKKQKRASRFGVTTGASPSADRPKLNITGAAGLFQHSIADATKDATKDAGKLADRAKRFGTAQAGQTEEEKAKLDQRAARFGTQSTQPAQAAPTVGANLTWNREDDERKKRRAERFQPGSATGEAVEKKQKTEGGAVEVAAK